MVPATLKWAIHPGSPGHQVGSPCLLAGRDRRTEARRDEDGMAGKDDLERRRRELGAAIEARRPVESESDRSKSSGMAGFGNALKLSSEFIAGIIVGAGLGWMIDRYAGTSPFGLIIFLLLGFCAGVLNALRSAGLMAQPLAQPPSSDEGGSDKN